MEGMTAPVAPSLLVPVPCPVRLAVVGAGPRRSCLGPGGGTLLPEVSVTVFDARPADRDVSGDPRTLALSQGSVQTLQRLGLWAEMQAGGHVAAIREVHVSQQQPTVLWPGDHQPESASRRRNRRCPSWVRS